MYYKFTLEELDDSWAYVLTLNKHAPTTIKEANTYADEHLSAADPYGIRHFVLLRRKKIVQIQRHQVLRLLPQLNPNEPASIQMPTIHAIMFGTPAVSSLLIAFKDSHPQTATAYGISPNVFLVFDNAELAHLYITDVYTVIADVG